MSFEATIKPNVYIVGYTMNGIYKEHQLSTLDKAKDILKLMRNQKGIAGLNLSEWEYNIVYEEYIYVKSIKFTVNGKGEIICEEKNCQDV